jgi:hypothetical protein
VRESTGDGSVVSISGISRKEDCGPRKKSGRDCRAETAVIHRRPNLQQGDSNMRKLSLTQQWMIDHPDDEPCPRNHSAAQRWRRKRGLERDPIKEAKQEADRTKYEAAIAEKRARERGQQNEHR